MLSSAQRIGQLEAIKFQLLYLKACEWQNTIDTLEEEVDSFRDVFQQYFSEPGPDMASRTREIQRKLYELDIRKRVVQSEIHNHMAVLTMLVKGLITRDEERLRDQNSSIDARLKELNLSFKRFKADISDFSTG